MDVPWLVLALVLALLRHELLIAIRRAERDVQHAAGIRPVVSTEPAGNTQVA